MKKNTKLLPDRLIPAVTGNNEEGGLASLDEIVNEILKADDQEGLVSLEFDRDPQICSHNSGLPVRKINCRLPKWIYDSANKIIIILGVFLLAACYKDNYNDGGTEDLTVDCSVWEFIQRNHKFDSMSVAIQHAGLVDYFDKIPSGTSGFTLFALSNESIAQFLYNSVDETGNRIYMKVSDIPVGECKEMIRDYVIEGAYLLQELPYEILGTLDGGLETENLNGKPLRVYRIAATDKYSPERLGIHAKDKGFIGQMQTTNIVTQNGVIHVLNDLFKWNKF